MLPVIMGLIAGGTAFYVLARNEKKRARPVAARGAEPRVGFGGDAALSFYAARFMVGDVPIEPEHVLAAALYDARVVERLRALGIVVETAQADLLAMARHAQSPFAEPHDFNPGEHYGTARVSVRLLVSGRRARQIAIDRGASTISLGDLLRAFRERGGVLAQLIGSDDKALATLDVERTVDISKRTVAAEDFAGEVDVFAVNDDRTTMALVLSLLTEVWALSASRAAWVMNETHDKGHGYIGRFAAADARQRVARSTVKARSLDMPLSFASCTYE